MTIPTKSLIWILIKVNRSLSNPNMTDSASDKLPLLVVNYCRLGMLTTAASAKVRLLTSAASAC